MLPQGLTLSLQGRDAARRGSAVPLQEEVPTPGGTRLSRSSRETSVEISAIGTEESERSEYNGHGEELRGGTGAVS